MNEPNDPLPLIAALAQVEEGGAEIIAGIERMLKENEQGHKALSVDQIRVCFAGCLEGIARFNTAAAKAPPIIIPPKFHELWKRLKEGEQFFFGAYQRATAEIPDEDDDSE